MSTEQKLLTVKQTAELLGVNRQRVLQLISANRLPARKVGSYYTIFESDVEALKTQPRKAGRPARRAKEETNGTAEKPFKTIFDVCPQVVGSVKSGLPSDLSSNKKHLEGLGRD